MRLVLILLFIYSSANAQTSGGYTPPSGGSNINVSDSAWGLIGNSNTNNATNFIGTTNNVGLSFRTNNIIRQTIDNKVVKVSETITDISSVELTSAISDIDSTIESLVQSKQVYQSELEKVIELEKQLSTQKRKVK